MTLPNLLHIHTSNRLEYLIQILATILKTPLPNPLEKEIIVVQSQGMQRWVSIQLAEQLGIWTNGHFLFPDALLWRVFKDVLGHLPDTSPFESPVTAWCLMDLIPHFTATPGFESLQHYLTDDEQGVKCFQLATRIADLFDQYSVYRPQMITQWETHAPAETHWQAVLWRALVERQGHQHRAKLRNDFFNQIKRTQNSPRLPKRLSLFGLSALPPFHLEVFAALGQLTEVHVFLLNPCREYWGDIVSDSEMAYKIGQVKRKQATPTEALLHFKKGNSLLASLGKLGRDFIDLLNEQTPQIWEYFVEPGEKTLLTCIQADILQLQERGDIGVHDIDAKDRSIQIQICHSPMREVEVLHDQLLALFEAEPTLLPKDVLVMAPDIEAYAPFIQAVFATITDEKQRIPFSIADRSLRRQSALIETFFTILQLRKSRFTANDILAILDVEAVRKRFGLLEQDLVLIQHWLDKVGIRWGMDGKHRQQMGAPVFEENTWRAGFARLLLGYALPQHPLFQAIEPKQERLFQGLLPFDALEGHDTLILGKLITLVDSLFNYIQALVTQHTLPQWAELLTALLADFFVLDDDTEAEAQSLRNILAALVEQSRRAHFDQTVSSEVVVIYLRRYLEYEPTPAHFLTGQVCFCTLLPMRSIPFKVVYLLGMNDQAYPRAHKALSFDLIAQKPQRGDRSRRHNDRYLFLESLLSARHYFYISYVGQHIRDNSLMPPSVVVSELIDYINRGFQHPQYPILTHLICRHPLQAFSPRYFDPTETQLFSFSQENCAASTAIRSAHQTTTPFIARQLPAITPATNTIAIDQLAQFFRHPAAFLLQQRLGIALPQAASFLEDHEPFELQGLTRYMFKQHLVEKNLIGLNLKTYQAIAKAAGQLPYGRLGETLYQQLCQQVYLFVKQIRHATQQDKQASQAVHLPLTPFLLIGRLNRLWSDHLLHYRCGQINAKDHIQLWIHHLVLNSLPDQLPRHSVLIGENGVWQYQPVAHSQAILRDLLNLYQQGQQHPLFFFPESSAAFAEAVLCRGKTTKEALNKALNQWLGNSFMPGEGKEAYWQLCLGQQDEMDLLGESFKQLALQVFEPLLTHRMTLETV